MLISDQGREFVNNVKFELFALTGTEHHETSAYHPQSNRLTERFNQTIQKEFVKLVDANQNDWEDHLSAVLFAYRTTQQKATKLTPFEIMYYRRVCIWPYFEFINLQSNYLQFQESSMPIGPPQIAVTI